MLELTYVALFMNSAAAKRMNAIARAVRRREKARFLFIMYGLIGQKFSISLLIRENDGDDEKNHNRKKKTQQHVYVHEHHSKHEPNCEVQTKSVC
jgi:hypothetical protein